MSSKLDTACGKAWLEECHDLPCWGVRYISMSAWVSLHFVHRSRFIRAVSKGTENKLEGITFPPTAVGFPLMRFSEDVKWTHLISGYILEAVLEETLMHLCQVMPWKIQLQNGWILSSPPVTQPLLPAVNLSTLGTLQHLQVPFFLSVGQDSEKLPQARKRNKRRK